MARRRGHGDGSIYFEEARNRWVGALDLGVGVDGNRIRRRVTGATRREVRDKLRRLQADHDGGLPAPDGNLTVGQFLRSWLTGTVEPTAASPNTVDNYRWAVHTHLEPALGNKRLRSLTADDVERMLLAKAEAGYARNTLTRIRSILVRALRHAERRGLVARNAATLVDTPNGPRQPARSLTEEQARALLDQIRGERLEALYLTGLMLGLRPGELLGLFWDDLDLDSRCLVICRSLKKEHAQLVIGPPKTRRSRRALDLPRLLADALTAHRERQELERIAAVHDWADTGLVFTTTKGTPIDPSNLRRDFSRLTRAAGLGHWHPHELRHSAASLLSAAGVPIEQIADLLGHTSIRITAQVYRHSIRSTVDAAVEPMEQMFGHEEPQRP